MSELRAWRTACGVRVGTSLRSDFSATQLDGGDGQPGDGPGEHDGQAGPLSQARWLAEAGREARPGLAGQGLGEVPASRPENVGEDGRQDEDHRDVCDGVSALVPVVVATALGGGEPGVVCSP